MLVSRRIPQLALLEHARGSTRRAGELREPVAIEETGGVVRRPGVYAALGDLVDGVAWAPRLRRALVRAGVGAGRIASSQLGPVAPDLLLQDARRSAAARRERQRDDHYPTHVAPPQSVTQIVGVSCEQALDVRVGSPPAASASSSRRSSRIRSAPSRSFALTRLIVWARIPDPRRPPSRIGSIH